MTGSLQSRKGKHHSVLNLSGQSGERKQRSINLHIDDIPGNKRKAVKAHREVLAEYERKNIHVNIKSFQNDFFLSVNSFLNNHFLCFNRRRRVVTCHRKTDISSNNIFETWFTLFFYTGILTTFARHTIISFLK